MGDLKLNEKLDRRCLDNARIMIRIKMIQPQKRWQTPISVIFNQITWEHTAYSRQVLQYFLECHQELDAYSTSYRIGKDF